MGTLENQRPCPNPNVLVELGYALHRLPTERILLVMNTVHGGVETLPFDIQKSRVIGYQLETGGKKPPERNRLREELGETLSTVLRVPVSKALRPKNNRLFLAAIIGLSALLGSRFFLGWLEQRISQSSFRAASLGGP